MKEFMELVDGRNWHFSIFRESRLAPLIHALGGEYEDRKGMDHRILTGRVANVQRELGRLPAAAKVKYHHAIDYLEAELAEVRAAMQPVLRAPLLAPILPIVLPAPPVLAVPALPGFEGQALLQRVWTFVHPDHGTLTITRLPKAAHIRQITFGLRLQKGGKAINSSCGLYVTNHDASARGADRSSVGYGDIDLENPPLDGMGIIYPIHRCMCETGEQVGVNLFLVSTVVSAGMHAVMERGGMGAAAVDGCYQAGCAAMRHRYSVLATGRGWR